MASSSFLYFTLLLLPFFAPSTLADKPDIIAQNITVDDDADRSSNYLLIAPFHPNASATPFTKDALNANAIIRPESAARRRWRGLHARSFLNAHNAVRARLRLPPLAWDRKLARYARGWGWKVASTGCSPRHSGGPYGENVFWGSGSGWTPAAAVKIWAAEGLFYNIAWNACMPLKVCGHYTQMVWKSTRRVGCDWTKCPSGDVFITCTYDPPGNYIGERPF